MAPRCTSVTPPNVRPKTLKPVRANAGVEAEYYRGIMREVEAMQRSLMWWIRARYRTVAPEIAKDASPFEELQGIVAKLIGKWRIRFNEVSSHLARAFVDSAASHADASMQKGMREAGMMIKFRPTRGVQRAIRSSVEENVLLIKSIGEHHLSEVGQLVQRAMQNGGSLRDLTKELQERYGITKRRAAFISQDQNAKATTAIRRQRQIETGLFEAEWVHSSAGRHPRESHVKAGRERLRFDIRKGAEIDDKWILPGQLPRCRCTWRLILPGHNDS